MMLCLRRFFSPPSPFITTLDRLNLVQFRHMFKGEKFEV